MARVSKTVRLSEPAREVWKRVGDFGAIQTWRPAVAATRLGTDGTVRRLQLADGGVLVDTSLEQGDLHYTYRLDSGPLPVKGYLGTLRVRETGDDRAMG